MIRKYLLRCLAFFAVFAGIYLGIIFFITGNTTEEFKLEENINKIFLGNSHFQAGINDSLIHNSFNFSRSAEHTEWVYPKLKLLKEANPQIDTVFIGLDNVLPFHNDENEKYNYGMFSPYFISKYSFFDWLNILFKAPEKYKFAFLSHLLKSSNLHIIFHDKGNARTKVNIGRFDSADRYQLGIDTLSRTFSKEFSDEYGMDELSTYFIPQILKYCEDNKIKIIFLFVPQHPKSHASEHPIHRIHKEKYPEIEYWDFSGVALPDSCYGDIDHLNYRGARQFSLMLDSIIKAGGPTAKNSE